MSSHATVDTQIKSVAVLDRTLRHLKCQASKPVVDAYVAGHRVSGQQFNLPGHHRGSVVAEITTGQLHLDSDYARQVPAFVDEYSIAAIEHEAEQNGYSHKRSVNAEGEQTVEVYL